MFLPTTYPTQLSHQDEKVGEEFSLLIWNIHKENQTPVFKKKFYELILSYPSDFLLFQELRYPKNSSFLLSEYSYVLSSNIESQEDIFGVLTASKFSFTNIQVHKTSQKELGFLTHKSLLITQHKLPNEKTLCIVNIHSINFVPLYIFTQELKLLRDELIDFDGALIIAGDFNTWSSGRMREIESFQKKLSLKYAEVQEKHHVKHMFLKPLDHIFYRGLELIQAQAIDTAQVSDHNPIYTRFRVV